jgi:hypothetical protein
MNEIYVATSPPSAFGYFISQGDTFSPLLARAMYLERLSRRSNGQS